MTLRKRPDWVSDADWAAYVGGGKETKSNGEKLSEDSLALAFVERHGHDLRYAAAWSKWLKWASMKWEQEKTLAAFDLARKIVRETPNSNSEGTTQ